MIKRVRKLLLVYAVVLLMLCGCNLESNGVVNDTDDTEEKIQIGVSFESFVIERWLRERDIFISKASELGAEVNVQIANGNLEEQISQIEYFIEKKVDVIVIVAADSDGLTEVVDKAKKEGIKVVAYDRLINNADIDLYISFDNVEVGRLMTEEMISEIGDSGKILIIMGPHSDNNVSLVMDGIQSALRKTNIIVDKIVHAEGWQGEIAYDEVNKYISSGKVPLGIICGNDTLAGNAVRALSENRLVGTVYVTGQDADLDACQRIVEGTQDMTVYKDVELLATQAARLCVDLATDQALSLKDTINNGKKDIPCQLIQVAVVTADNMDDIITGRYHQKSDIYLNVPKTSDE